MDQSEAQVEVRCEAQVLAGKLALTYSVTNRTGATVLVFDRMRDWAKEWHYDPPKDTTRLDVNWAYVEIDNGMLGDTARVSRGMAFYANLMEHPQMPFARELAAGQTLHDRFTVPLPADENVPGKEARLPTRVPYEERYQPGHVQHLVFEVGWAPAPPPPQATKVTIDGEQLWYVAFWHYEPLFKQQRFARAAPISISFDVRRFVSAKN